MIENTTGKDHLGKMFGAGFSEKVTFELRAAYNKGIIMQNPGEQNTRQIGNPGSSGPELTLSVSLIHTRDLEATAHGINLASGFVFMNKVLLEHSLVHLFTCDLCCFCATKVEWSSCGRARGPLSLPYVFLALHRKTLCIPGVDRGTQQVRTALSSCSPLLLSIPADVTMSENSWRQKKKM